MNGVDWLLLCRLSNLQIHWLGLVSIVYDNYQVDRNIRTAVRPLASVCISGDMLVSDEAEADMM